MLFDDKRDYLKYFYEKSSDFYNEKQNPLLAKEILEICLQIETQIENISSFNFFKTLSKILGLDARLQIILELESYMSDDEYKMEEQEIINLSRKDYIYYIKEKSGIPLVEPPIHSLYFLVK
ncbi:DUF7006 family protein [Enterococcus faecalis]|uniref:DUF7006 family protein n=1 Tax=Enterococcus faecalis TaxID=1351 RepID=UPI0018E1401D|nr:hypothetical protein [Enterococcus faecalis]MBI0605124.1 hypothetical protein [Enterococcus faecalis]